MLEVQEDRVGQARRESRGVAFNGQRVGFCFLVHSGDIQQCSAQADRRALTQALELVQQEKAAADAQLEMAKAHAEGA